MDTAERFVHLFRGRADAYGSWGGPAVRERLTPERFHRHLSSPHEADWFGVYNVIGDLCSWGCVDIDTDDLPLAQNIRTALGVKGIPAWTEQTTRGYHVWCFPESLLVSAAVMRQALTAACYAVGYSPKEVFPKQTRVTGNGLGNFVRLPYNGFWSGGEHVPRMFTDHHGDGFDALLVQMDTDRAPTELLIELAEMMPKSQRVDISVDRQATLPDVRLLDKTAYLIWKYGPSEIGDRSTTLVRLARLMAEQEFPPERTMAVILDADERWGKRFADRGASGEAILQRIIAKAYS